MSTEQTSSPTPVEAEGVPTSEPAAITGDPGVSGTVGTESFGPGSSSSTDALVAGWNQLRAQRPELAAGVTFTGGMVLALILKRLAR